MAKKTCKRVSRKVSLAARRMTQGKTKAIRSNAAEIVANHQHQYH